MCIDLAIPVYQSLSNEQNMKQHKLLSRTKRKIITRSSQTPIYESFFFSMSAPPLYVPVMTKEHFYSSSEKTSSPRLRRAMRSLRFLRSSDEVSFFFFSTFSMMLPMASRCSPSSSFSWMRGPEPWP